MKKLVAISTIILALAACSNEGKDPHGKPPHNPEMEVAMQECQKTVTNKEDRTAFDACMKAKGFEKPADHGKGPQPPKASN
ncbi:hypothetical protein EXH44_07370 [Actinobacillus indolicus]|uniref:Uncharacterized protein n=1 Tax=Actinobacillus indolicus TaxID=51049 RepID=A0A4P7CIY6_9PAST|nr:hypothetical protein [Actinobacillus indolicus]QBQ64055.1 hypothetical protein EXH44_07370 [Actinobacillus indolicus]